MSKSINVKIIAIFLAFILSSSICLPVFAEDNNNINEVTDKTNDIYPNLDLSLYTVDKIPDELRESILSDNSSQKSVSPLNADDLYSITIDNGDGTNTLNVFKDPVKYIDNNGTVQFRTNAIEKSPRSGFLGLLKADYAYMNEEGAVKTYFSDRIDKGVCLVYNECKITMIPLTDSKKFPDVKALIGKETINSETNTSKAVSIATPYNLTTSKSSFVYSENKIEYRNVLSDGITYEYMPIANGIKENIILNKYNGINAFRFIINMGDLVPEAMAVRGNGIRLINQQNPGDALIISPVNAIDADGKLSLDHAMYFTETEIPGQYILTVVIDRAFLESPETVYPVTIDPTVYPDTTANIADTFVSSNHSNINYSTQSFMPVGVDVNYAQSEIFLQFNGIQRYRYIAPDSISDVLLKLDCYYTTGTSSNPVQIYAYDNSSHCDISQITWANKPSTYGSGFGIPSGNPINIPHAGLYQLYLTDIVKKWFKHEVNEGGFSYQYSLRLKQYNSNGTTHYATFRTTEFGRNYPYFMITYTPSTPFTETTLVQITNRGSMKHLDAGQANDFSVVQYDADYRLNQWWEIIHLGNGIYKFENQWEYYQTQGRKMLSVSEASSTVDLYYESDSLLTQRFYILPCYSSGGSSQGYRIVSLYNVDQPGTNGNKAISNGNSTANGTGITYSTYNGNSNAQKWLINEPQEKAIIIIPGIMGSQIFADGEITIPASGFDLPNTFNNGTRLWNPSTNNSLLIDEKIRALSCDSLGNPVYSTTVNSPTINQYNLSGSFQYGATDIYRSLYNTLYNNYYADDYDIVLYEYDWREDPYKTSIKLSNFILSQNYGEIVFVSHSMGGLVSSYYLSLGSAQRNLVDKHISVGTPYLGSVEMPYLYVTGNIRDAFYENWIVSDTIVDIAYNIPSIYGLFPFEQKWRLYLSYRSDPSTTTTCYNFDSTIGAFESLMPNWNSAVADEVISNRSRLFINNGNHITSMVDSYYIVGTGEPTTFSTCGLPDNLNNPTQFSMFTLSKDLAGDGTVTEYSATIGNSTPNDKTFYKHSSSNKTATHVGMINGVDNDLDTIDYSTINFIVTIIDEDVDTYSSAQLSSIFGITQ